MKVGAHDVSAIRFGCLNAFRDAAILHGIKGDDAEAFERLIMKGVASVAPLISDGSPALTLSIPLAYTSNDAVACGSTHSDGTIASYHFDITGGIYHVGSLHKYAFACSRNRRSLSVSRGTTNLFGSVLLHSEGVRRKMFLFDENGNLTSCRKKVSGE